MTDLFQRVPQLIYDSQPRVSRRGPHSELQDAQLHNRRDQLVQTFEGAWGEIGWELYRCKKADDLVPIFSPLCEGYIRDIISVFCRASAEPGSATILRKIRAKLRVAVERRYEADKPYQESLEQLHQADWALAQATKGKRRIVRRERKKRRKGFAKAAQFYRSLSETEHNLEVQLRHLEASFARQQIFRFLKSKRYELTPLSLANAAAGLPYMGWRQSMRRSKKAECGIADGRLYQVFKSIRYLTRTANRKMENALVAHFREAIPSLPSRYRHAKVELAAKWWYVERAIRQAVRSKSHPKALPYEITKRYLKQTRSESRVDMVVAEQSRLSLPG